ncbi:DUF2345 domain-containing protein, partial [Pseudomonas panipatensis]
VRITAKKKITLNAGGSYITLDQNRIECGTLGDYNVKSVHFERVEAQARLNPDLPWLADKQREQGSTARKRAKPFSL